MPRRRSKAGPLAAAVIVVLAAAVGVLAFLLLHSDTSSRTLTGSAGTHTASANTGFTLRFPKKWQAMSAQELAAIPNHPLAVVRRKDGKGIVVVRAAKGAVGDAAAFAHQLDAEFRKKLPNDYRPVEAKLVVLPAGKAFLFSYVRTKKRTLNTLVIVPVPTRSYVFNAISVPGDKEVAGDIGTILKSFKPVSGG